MVKAIKTADEMRGGIRSARFSSWLHVHLNLRRGSIIVGLVCTALAIFYAEENWRGRRAWENYRVKLISKGVVFDWHALMPPPVPDDAENFAMTPLVAALFDFAPGTYAPRDTRAYARASMFGHLGEPFRNSVDPVPDWAEGRRIDLAEALQLVHKQKVRAVAETRPGSVELPSDRKSEAFALLNALEEMSPILAELRDASARPKSRFNLNYNEKEHWNLAEPHLDLLRRVSVILALRASAELMVDKSEQAAEDLELILSLANTIRDVPLGGSQWTRNLLLGHARHVIWEGLADHRWSDDQLEGFQSQLKQINLVNDAKARLRLERATGDHLFELVREKPSIVKGWFGPGFMAWMRSFSIQSRPSGWLADDRIYYHRLCEKVERGLDVQAGHIQPGLINHAGHGGALSFPIHALANVLIEGPTDILVDAAFAQTMINQTILACDLEHHQLRHHQLPERLDELGGKPERDVITGEPLKYRRLDESRFTLYSVGWNEVDDGGVIATNGAAKTADPTHGDWVWPAYPRK
ncbi:MAG: hypothetical protein JWM99_2745 [Verrucomicrobiales bacterium]|nr:hypothetical protein [Verrucomicrobiales bacterium]